MIVGASGSGALLIVGDGAGRGRPGRGPGRAVLRAIPWTEVNSAAAASRLATGVTEAGRSRAQPGPPTTRRHGGRDAGSALCRAGSPVSAVCDQTKTAFGPVRRMAAASVPAADPVQDRDDEGVPGPDDPLPAERGPHGVDHRGGVQRHGGAGQTPDLGGVRSRAAAPTGTRLPPAPCPRGLTTLSMWRPGLGTTTPPRPTASGATRLWAAGQSRVRDPAAGTAR